MQIQRQSQVNMNSDTCLILGVFSDHSFTPLGVSLNTKTEGTLTKLVKSGTLGASVGASLFVPFLPHVECKALLVQCGDLTTFQEKTYLKILNKAGSALSEIKTKEIYCALTQLPLTSRDDDWKAFQAATILGAKFYRFDQLKTENVSPPTVSVLNIDTQNEKPIKEANTFIEGLTFLKNLANLPANICTPDYLADEAKKMAQTHKTLKVEVLEENEMEKLGMNTLLAVTKGSKQPAKLICFHYQGGKNTQKPYVFVGKGITFDTGGISLKPSSGMMEMKYDMCGGATIFALMQIAATLQLPLNIIGLVPAAENMPSGEATRPSDIVKSMSGKTIEILNTDAEGRLILCDTLTYAERFSPEIVIDVATLTGGAIMTFGNIANVIMGNDDALMADLMKASEQCGERTWTLPLWEEYQDMLKSNCADLPNIHADANAKTIIAGCFLSRFAQKFRWAHLDVAGSAFTLGKDKSSTGRPLLLLLSYLQSKV